MGLGSSQKHYQLDSNTMVVRMKIVRKLSNLKLYTYASLFYILFSWTRLLFDTHLYNVSSMWWKLQSSTKFFNLSQDNHVVNLHKCALICWKMSRSKNFELHHVMERKQMSKAWIMMALSCDKLSQWNKVSLLSWFGIKFESIKLSNFTKKI